MVNLHLKPVQDRLVSGHCLPATQPAVRRCRRCSSLHGSSLPLLAWASPFQIVRQVQTSP